MNRITISALVLGSVALVSSPLGDASSRADNISEAAKAFIQTLNEEQRAITVMPIDTDERATWSNLPIIMVRPAGLLIKEMTDEQRHATHGLMRATMSSQGYAKFSGIMLLEDLLYQIESQSLQSDQERREDPIAKAFLATRDYENYALAIFGKPGNSEWGWKIAGHHAAMNFTISEGRLGFTPTFLGSSPMQVQGGRYAGLTALPHEGIRGIELMQSLSNTQREKAIIATEAANDVFEGPGRRNSLKSFEGLSTKNLTDDQMHLLHRLVEEYLHNADHDAAHAQMAAIKEAGWDQLWFSWRGPIDLNGMFYYRVHGPRILIEYNRQDANHDHMIVRDPSNDYGEDWLGTHYEEHHPTMGEAMKNVRRTVESETH